MDCNLVDIFIKIVDWSLSKNNYEMKGKEREIMKGMEEKEKSCMDRRLRKRIPPMKSHKRK